MSNPNLTTHQAQEVKKLTIRLRELKKKEKALIENLIEIQLREKRPLKENDERSETEIQKIVNDRTTAVFNNQELIEIQKQINKAKFDLSVILDTERKPEESQPWMLTYPHDLGEVPYKMNYIMITFYEYQTDVRMNNKLEKIIYPQIKLPLSSRLLYSALQIDYSREPLNQLNNVLYNNAREYGATSGGIYQAIGETGDEPNETNMLEGFMYSQLLTTDLKGVRAGYHGSGLAYNRNITARFIADNPRVRIFFPSWTFIPRKKKDAEVLGDVIRAIKKNVLPSVYNSKMDKRFNYNNNFKYPRLVKLQVFINGKEYKKAKYLPMAIERYEVSNNDKVSSSVTDNVPLTKDGDEFYNTETTLNLTFKELIHFTKDHVDHVFQLN